MTTGKTIALTIQKFVSKVMSLFLNTLSMFVIAFLPRSKHLLISWLQSLSTVILEPEKRKSVTVSTLSLSIHHEVMRPDVMILDFLMLSFKSVFSLTSFTSSRGSLAPLHFLPLEWYYLHIWGCWYFFLLGILFLACDSSSLAFYMIYSAYKLNEKGDNIQPCTPFTILK